MPLYPGMAQWPGSPPFKIERIEDMNAGAAKNFSAVTMSLHAGTHVDAPLHSVKQEAGVEEIPFDTVIGPVRVIGIEDESSIRPAELEKHRIQCGDRVLFRTRNSERCYATDDFCPSYVSLSREAAELLARSAVRFVGVDYLSVGPYPERGGDIHRTLLSAGVWLIEGLNLSKVRPGLYDMICMPLNLPGAEASPARAILRARFTMRDSSL